MAARKSTPPNTPEVFVDFIFDRGLLHVAVINNSDAAATEVAVSFDPPFRGLGGEVEVSSLPLFRRIAFLAPHKRIETLLDTSAAYFERDEPTAIVAMVTYNDAAGHAHKRRIAHDIAIYRDIAYVVSPPAGTMPESTARPTPDTGTVRHGRPQG
jgi:hypothetical protein